MESNQHNLFSKTPLTQRDLQDFKNTLILEIKELILIKEKPKKWLRSSEVIDILHISAGTLQKFRCNKTLSFTKLGGIIYYNQ